MATPRSLRRRRASVSACGLPVAIAVALPGTAQPRRTALNEPIAAAYDLSQSLRESTTAAEAIYHLGVERLNRKLSIAVIDFGTA